MTSFAAMTLTTTIGWDHSFWFSKFSCLAMVILLMDFLPTFKYTLDILGHILLNKHVMNTFIIDDIYK